ncbi:MAG: hypothetical protein AAFQ80_05150 [Cyanobacteria bacterium J06621_8]
MAWEPAQRTVSQSFDWVWRGNLATPLAQDRTASPRRRYPKGLPSGRAKRYHLSSNGDKGIIYPLGQAQGNARQEGFEVFQVCI